MFRINFEIPNPWFKHNGKQKTYFSKYFELSTNKGCEIEILKTIPYHLFSIQLDLSWRGMDHHGPSFEIKVWRYEFIIAIQDKRHWDYDEGTWAIYSDGSN